ncbi:MAG: phosphoglycerate mutase [Nitrosomonas sp.]|nr:phosphoglycerate mutase [Nitrosomonas sp.]
MNLHLFIPALFWSDTTFPEIYQDLPTPALATLLAKSRTATSSATDINAWLCKAFNIEKQCDWPVAPIMQRMDSSEQYIDSSRDYWLRADPVHLRIEQNHIMLADRFMFQITPEEALQFSEAINQILVHDNMTVLPLNPYRWYIRLSCAPELHTQTLNAATCNNINHLMPTGKDGITWHKITNEIQMLLHDHPLNQERAARDQLAINSLWFWGGGFMPQSAFSPYTAVWSNDHFAQALTLLCDINHRKLPDTAESWLQQQTNSNTENQLIVLDNLLNSEKYNDAYQWRENLKKLEQDWFFPLYAALKNNRINSIRISSVNEQFSHDFFVKPSSLWKFWSSIKPLSFYADKP